MSNEYDQEYVDRGTDRLGLHVYPDPEVADAPVAVIWPAMGVPARYYRPFAKQLRALGLGVVVADLRGTGTSTPAPSRQSRYGYAELADDVGAVLEALKPRLDGRRVILLGHSLGGQACVLHLAHQAGAHQAGAHQAGAHQAGAGAGTDGVVGLILVAVGLPWFRSYGSPWRSLSVLAYTQWIAATAAVVGVWPGWGFGGRQSRGVIRDWGYTARHGRFPVIGGADVEAALSKITLPVLAITVDGDQYTPPATTDQLCAKLTGSPVERAHVTAAEAGAPIDHFTWVGAGAPIADRVAAIAGRA